MKRREFIQSAVCSMACVSFGNLLHASSKPFKTKTGSQSSNASSNEVFTMELEQEFLGIYSNYVDWLKTLVERLGYERMVAVWDDAYRNCDEKKLNEILSNGWTQKNDDKFNNVNEIIDNILSSSFSSPVEGLTKDQARRMIEAAPPVKQIRKNFTSVKNQVKDVTAYDYIHLTEHGRALLVESLLKHHKKEGELIAYDFIRERRIKGAEKDTLSVEQLISAIGSITKSDKPNLMTAALKADIISSSEKEIVLHVKECEWARYFKENHPDVGYLMLCSTDEAAYRTGAKNRIRMQRASTIMEGGEICDFRVYAVS
jgi:uncharacterized protein (UPF0297 family)